MTIVTVAVLQHIASFFFRNADVFCGFQQVKCSRKAENLVKRPLKALDKDYIFQKEDSYGAPFVSKLIFSLVINF